MWSLLGDQLRIAEVSGAIVLGGLVSAVLLTVRLPRRGADLQPGADTVDLGHLSVVIPARDEAHNLPGVLASVTAAGPVGEVIVVDDGSSDGSAEVAAAHGATVVDAGELPEGWAGKPHACQVGADHASGSLLVFLDADVRVAPHGLAQLAAAHDSAGGRGLLSVQPFHVTERIYEQASAIPNVVSMMASGAFGPGSSGRSTLAFGPCLAIDADSYRAVGGHRAVRASVIEDVALAHVVASAGLPVHCHAGGGALSFRMYPTGPGALLEGWTKNLASGATSAALLPTLGATWWIVALCTAAVDLLDPSGPAVLAYLALAAQLAWVLHRIGRFRWWVPLCFPAPLLVFTWCFGRSVVDRARGVTRWRGRQVLLRPRSD